MEQINQIDKAISTVGSLSALSELLGESPQTVSNWRSRQVPADRCPSIERATHGAVRCEELRPDVDWAYLRGTKKRAAAKSADKTTPPSAGGNPRVASNTVELV